MEKKSFFHEIADIHSTQYTYCEKSDKNIMFVGTNMITGGRKPSNVDIYLMFTKEQIVEMYESMLSMEVSNSKFLKK